MQYAVENIANWFLGIYLGGVIILMIEVKLLQLLLEFIIPPINKPNYSIRDNGKKVSLY